MSAWAAMRIEFLRAEILLHVLPGGLDQSGLGADLLHLYRRGVAPHVLLLDDLFQAGPIAEAVGDVLDHPLLPRRMVLDAEQPVPEGPLLALLGHPGPPLPRVVLAAPVYPYRHLPPPPCLLRR